MARYLIDANLPRKFSIWNNENCVFAVDLGRDLSDAEIWDYAEKHELTIVTKDADFAHRVLLSASGPSVIHLRVGNIRLRDLYVYLRINWDQACKLSSANRLVELFDDGIETTS